MAVTRYRQPTSTRRAGHTATADKVSGSIPGVGGETPPPRPRRTVDVSFRTTPDEKAIIEAKAQRRGLTPSEYARMMTLGEERVGTMGLPVTLSPENRSVLVNYQTQLHGMATNLNQLARNVNRLGYAPEDEALLQERLASMALLLQEEFLKELRVILRPVTRGMPAAAVGCPTGPLPQERPAPSAAPDRKTLSSRDRFTNKKRT